MRKIDPILHEKLAALISQMGYELLGCELYPQGRQMVFRLFIDGNEESKSVTLADCSLVSHQVSAMLDVENPIQSRYALEISSPGIDRPLFELKHYQRFIGSEVKIRLVMPINQRRQYKGRLQNIVGEDIYLAVEGLEKEVVIPFSAIEKANVIGDVKF